MGAPRRSRGGSLAVAAALGPAPASSLRPGRIGCAWVGASLPMRRQRPPGARCSNSSHVQGAALGASGNASVAADTSFLAATDLSGSIAIFLQGGTHRPPYVVGDGLLCACGSLVRLSSRLDCGGSSVYPEPGDVSISARGSVGAPGTRTNHLVYRIAAAFSVLPLPRARVTSAPSRPWRDLDRTSRVRESRKSGSAGGRGRDPPGRPGHGWGCPGLSQCRSRDGWCEAKPEVSARARPGRKKPKRMRPRALRPAQAHPLGGARGDGGGECAGGGEGAGAAVAQARSTGTLRRPGARRGRALGSPGRSLSPSPSARRSDPGVDAAWLAAALRSLAR